MLGRGSLNIVHRTKKDKMGRKQVQPGTKAVKKPRKKAHENY